MMRNTIGNHIEKLKKKNVSFTKNDLEIELSLNGYLIANPYNYFVRDTKHYFRRYEKITGNKMYINATFIQWIEKYECLISQSLNILRYIHKVEKGLKLSIAETLIMKPELYNEPWLTKLIVESKKRDITYNSPIKVNNKCEFDEYSDKILNEIHDFTFGESIRFLWEISKFNEDMLFVDEVMDVVFNQKANCLEKEFLEKESWRLASINKFKGTFSDSLCKKTFEQIRNNNEGSDFFREYIKGHSQLNKQMRATRELIIKVLKDTVEKFSSDGIYFEKRFVEEAEIIDIDLTLTQLNKKLNEMGNVKSFRENIKSMITLYTDGVNIEEIRKNRMFKTNVDNVENVFINLLIDNLITNVTYRDKNYFIKKWPQLKKKFSININNSDLEVFFTTLNRTEFLTRIYFFEVLRLYRNDISHTRNIISTIVQIHDADMKLDMSKFFIQKGLIEVNDLEVFKLAQKYYQIIRNNTASAVANNRK